MTVHQLSHIT